MLEGCPQRVEKGRERNFWFAKNQQFFFEWLLFHVNRHFRPSVFIFYDKIVLTVNYRGRTGLCNCIFLLVQQSLMLLQ